MVWGQFQGREPILYYRVMVDIIGLARPTELCDSECE